MKKIKRMAALILTGALLFTGGMAYPFSDTANAEPVGEYTAYSRASYPLSYTAPTGEVYYDIDGGRVDNRTTDMYDIYLKAITSTADGGVSAAQFWAELACNIYANYPDVLFHTWDNQPFAMLFGDDNNSNSSTRYRIKARNALMGLKSNDATLEASSYFTEVKNESDYFTDSKNDAYTCFGATGAYDEFRHGEAGSVVTGFRKADSLADAKDDFFRMTAFCRESNSDKYKNFKAAQERAVNIPFMDNTTRQPVIYTYMGTIEHPKGACAYDYMNFGVVYYNFRLVPLCNEENFYFSDDLEKIIKEGDTTITSCSGFSYDSENSVDALVTKNNSASSVDAGKQTTYSCTETATTTMEEGISHTTGKDFSAGNEFSFAADSFKLALGLDFSFEDAYNNTYSESSSNQYTKEESTNISYTIPSYCVMTSDKQQEKATYNIEFNQAVSIQYNVAIIATRGYFYDDNINVIEDNFDNDLQYGFCTIFGNVNQNLEIDNTYPDAIASFYHRTHANSESNSYLKFTRSKHSEDYVTRLNWEDIDSGRGSVTQNENRDYGGTYADPPYRNTAEIAEDMDKYCHRMSATGGTMKINVDQTAYGVYQMTPMKPIAKLTAYRIGDQYRDNVFNGDTICVGDTFPMSYLTLHGSYPDGTEYPSECVDVQNGEWKLCDESGALIESSDVIKLYKDGGGNWVIKGLSEGTGYLKYVLHPKDSEHHYSYYSTDTSELIPVDPSDVTVPFLTFKVKPELELTGVENTTDGAKLDWKQPEDGDAVSYDIQTLDGDPADQAEDEDGDADAQDEDGDGSTDAQDEGGDSGTDAQGEGDDGSDAQDADGNAESQDAAKLNASPEFITGRVTKKWAGAAPDESDEYTDGWETGETISDIGTTTFIDSEIDNGQYRTYRVVARDEDGNIVALSKSIPTIWLKAVELENCISQEIGKAMLRWTKNPLAHGYQIQIQKGNNEPEIIDINTAEPTEHVLQDLNAGEDYTFRIRACASDGDNQYYSGWSAVRNIKIAFLEGWQQALIVFIFIAIAAVAVVAVLMMWKKEKGKAK